jgi:hypothetical protein
MERAGGMAQVVEQLSLTPTTTKNKINKEIKGG